MECKKEVDDEFIEDNYSCDFVNVQKNDLQPSLVASIDASSGSRSNKRNILTLEKKVQLLEDVDKNERSKKEIAEHYDIAPSTLTAILGNRGKIIDAHTSKTFHSQSQTQFSGPIFENLEEKLLTWIKESDETNVLYNDTILLEKTNEFAEDLGLTDFVASMEWIEFFRAKYYLNSSTDQNVSFK
jgi:hypothetical protein